MEVSWNTHPTTGLGARETSNQYRYMGRLGNQTEKQLHIEGPNGGMKVFSRCFTDIYVRISCCICNLHLICFCWPSTPWCQGANPPQLSQSPVEDCPMPPGKNHAADQLLSCSATTSRIPPHWCSCLNETEPPTITRSTEMIIKNDKRGI